jgi:phage shock protein PspC (stress-responsive transcriptional regulator)/uncharacterized protein YlzI (FlbEa/FlbD family)
MKKNISINIGGIIFHIEEDSYDRLNSYLSTINRYFESFDDSKEIIDDIENRIAEIFLSKLNDGKQVIIKEDVEELVQTMGTVADFEAQIEMEEKEQPTSESSEKESKQEEFQASDSTESTGQNTQKRLFRNNNQRILGGVASGIAHYFSIDPLWVRLLFLLVFFNILFPALTGAVFLAYIVLWIVVPGSNDLEEDKSYKKLYRNPDERVLGGVSSGIASFFGSDPTVIRLLFVLSIFLGGAGLILYIILWIITPEARSITEKMQMQGEPVTLSNIESNVKSSLKVKEGEENAFVKVLLFPFRLIALVFETLGRFLGPFLRFLVDAIRIFFGVLVIIVGSSLMFSSIVLWAVLLGVAEGWTDYVHLDDIPVEMFIGGLNAFTVTALMTLLFIPALAIGILGIVIILRRKVGSPYFGWSLFGFWIIALIITSFMVPDFIGNYRVEDDYKEERTLAQADTSMIPTLRLNRSLLFDDYDGVDLRLRGHSDSTYKVVVRYESRGRNARDARASAESLDYRVVFENDNIYFDEELDFTNQEFRFQTADVIFYIPFGQKFRMESELDEILINTLHLNDYRSYQMEGNDWIFDQSGILCLTCADRMDRSSESRNYGDKDERTDNWPEVGGETIDYDFADFESIKVNSRFYVEIVQGDEYIVQVKGRDAHEVRLTQMRDELDVKFRDDWDVWNRDFDRSIDLYLYVQAPQLSEIELGGACKGKIIGFDTPDMEITLMGASDMNAELVTDRLDINLSGASKLQIEGTSRTLDARSDGASTLKAFGMEAQYVDVRVNGASKAEVNASETLEADASGVSQIRYRGTARVNSNKDGLSTIKKD